MKKSRFLGKEGGGDAALSAAHISPGDKTVNTLDATIGNQTNLEFNREHSVTWLASMQIYWNKRNHLHKKTVQLPKDWFGTPTWPPFHCFGTPIWPL